MACAAGAVAILAAGLPVHHTEQGPAWHTAMTVQAAGASLNDVVATGARQAWAVGSSAAGQPVVYRWDGTRWQQAARPGPGSAAASVAASSPGNVWVSLAGAAALEHWNGHAWSRTGFGAPGRVDISGLTTTGRKNVWTFTYDSKTRKETAFHYNGRKWRGTRLPVSMGSGGSVRLASATSRHNVWAWGYDQRRGRWVSLHFNGRKWRVIGLPAGLLPAGRTVLPEQMLARSRKNVWGTVYAASGSTRGPVVLVHWNGHHWRRVTRGLPAGGLAGPMAPDGHGGLWLAAMRPGGAGYLAHYRHGHWYEAAVPAAAVSVSALAHIPGTSWLWGAATAGTSPGSSRGSVIMRYS
ncbi:MAG TPA: hypothetical protein VH637_24080 [Streptosporangiaceae bacterium]|jgi:hypothetical protein